MPVIAVGLYLMASISLAIYTARTMHKSEKYKGQYLAIGVFSIITGLGWWIEVIMQAVKLFGKLTEPNAD